MVSKNYRLNIFWHALQKCSDWVNRGGASSLIIGHVKRVEVLLLIVAVLTALGFHLVRVIAERQAGSSEKDVKRA